MPPIKGVGVAPSISVSEGRSSRSSRTSSTPPPSKTNAREVCTFSLLELLLINLI